MYKDAHKQSKLLLSIFFSFCHLTLWLIPFLQPSPPPAGIVKKGRTLSIIGSINEDDWTSEQEHIGLTPPTCSAPDVTHSHPECAHIPFVTAVFPGTGG